MRFFFGKSVLSFWVLWTAFIIAIATTRVWPHPWNLSPLGGLALFAGAKFRSASWGIFLTLIALALGDLVLGFHSTWLFVYAGMALHVYLGRIWCRNRNELWRIGMAGVSSAMAFFVISNFGVWWTMNLYPRTAEGLSLCFIAGLPFFQGTLVGNLLSSSLLFGLDSWRRKISTRTHNLEARKVGVHRTDASDHLAV